MCVLGKSLTLELHPNLLRSTLDRPRNQTCRDRASSFVPTAQLLVNAVLDFSKLVSRRLSSTRMQGFLDVEKQMVWETSMDEVRLLPCCTICFLFTP